MFILLIDFVYNLLVLCLIKVLNKVWNVLKLGRLVQNMIILFEYLMFFIVIFGIIIFILIEIDWLYICVDLLQLDVEGDVDIWYKFEFKILG